MSPMTSAMLMQAIQKPANTPHIIAHTAYSDAKFHRRVSHETTRPLVILGASGRKYPEKFFHLRRAEYTRRQILHLRRA